MQDTSTTLKPWLVLVIKRPRIRYFRREEYLTLITRLMRLSQISGCRMGWELLPDSFSVLTKDAALFSSARKMVKHYPVRHFTRSTLRRPRSIASMSWVERLLTFRRSVKDGR